MRGKLQPFLVLLGAGILLFLGRHLFRESEFVTWGLTFGGTTAAGLLGMALYRVQLELRASRQELAMKQAELNFALQVQRALFPREFPVDRGLEFSGVCVPARGISGDYFDVVPLTNGCVVFAIADISGKGISAAILMSNLQAVLRILANSGHSPGEVCARLNLHLNQVTDGGRFATIFYAEWNPESRLLRYVNAGHNAPLLLEEGSVEQIDPCAPPLGLFLESEFQVGERTLKPGSVMALYSDGLSEAGIDRGREYGETRLAAIVTEHACKPLAEIQHHVLDSVHQWAGQELEDDLTLLLVRATVPRKEAV
ncbi:MAG: PP2C family protein-serine/threonine phosphatase [Terriglobia bacterium]